MQRFFGTPTTEWKRLDNRLHIYVCPPIESRANQAISSTAKVLSDIPYLGVQPPEYIHATVQLLNGYWEGLQEHPDYGNALISAFESVAAQTNPFSLVFQSPVIREYAVETIADVNPNWIRFTDKIREAALGVYNSYTIPDCDTPDQSLPEAPYGAHISLAYGTACGMNEAIKKRLDKHFMTIPKQQLPCEYRVTSFSLVAVTQLRNTGIFGFHTIKEFSLR